METKTVDRLGEVISMLSAAIENLNDESKAVEKEGDLSTIAAHYYHSKLIHERLDDIRKKLYHRVDKVNKSIFPDKLIDNDMDKIRIPSLGRSFYIVDKHSASILEGMKESAFDWLRGDDVGGSEIISETVNAGTLAKFLKERLIETGKDHPDDIFKFSAYHTIGSSKYNPKK